MEAFEQPHWQVLGAALPTETWSEGSYLNYFPEAELLVL